MGFPMGRPNIGSEHKGKQEVPFFKVRSNFFWKNLILKKKNTSGCSSHVTDRAVPKTRVREGGNARQEGGSERRAALGGHTGTESGLLQKPVRRCYLF